MRGQDLLGIGFLASCCIVTLAGAQSVIDPALEVSVYACCPTSPTSIAFLPASPEDLLVLEKFSGRVLHFRDGVLQGTALDLAVSNYGERGLLGIALHPQFTQNSFVYLYYTSSPTAEDTPFLDSVLDNRVVRFTWNGSQLVTPLLVLRLPARPSFIHAGGVIHFGPDGMLYGVIGDVGRFGAGRMQNNASGNPPDTTSIVFRVRDDGTPPTSNPFYALGGAMQYVYGYGQRNSFGFDFDPQTGVLWQSENGPSDYDELNRILPGWNGGWSDLWGPDARHANDTSGLWVAPGSFYADPKFAWKEVVAPTSVLFYRSDSLGAHYRNQLFVGAHNQSGKIYRFQLTPDRSTLVLPDPSVTDGVADTYAEADVFQWGNAFGAVVDLEIGPDGALYVANFYGDVIYRIGRANTSDVAPIDARHPIVAAPNPFRTTTSFRVASPLRTLVIYDVTGRLVRILHCEHGTGWDGKDERGRPVAAGLYMARLRLADGRAGAGVKVVRLE